MIKSKFSEGRFFYVQCGDWDGFTIAGTPREACINCVDQALSFFGKNVKMTKVMVCTDPSLMLEDDGDATSAFLLDEILNEIYEH